jgi:hypothetical protein
MNRLWGLALLAIGIAYCVAYTEVPAAEEKGTTIEIDGLKASVPADWKEEKPKNRLRYKQFRLPKVKDDKIDGEMYIYKGLGGKPDENVKRWKDMFLPPEGKTIDDVSKQSEIKIGTKQAVLFEVYGTYKHKDAPFDPKSKLELRPDHRMVAVQYDGEDDTYHFRLIGPAATVDHYRKGFEDWLKALKK